MKKDILKQEVNLKSVLIIVVAILSFVAYISIFLFPKYIEYKSVKDELNLAEEELLSYQAKLDNMPIVEEKLNSVNYELVSKSSKFRHEMNDGMFLIGLDKYRRTLGIDLIEYKIEDVIEYENINAIPVDMTVRGNYKHIRDLMYYLEEQKNMTQVLDYNIEIYVKELSQNTTSHTNDQQQSIVVKPKAIGDVTATLKFVMYTNKNPNLELNTDDSGKWTPGKYNPFVPTT